MVKPAEGSALRQLAQNAQQGKKQSTYANRVAADQELNKQTWLETVKKVIYNSEKGEILTRTPSSWFLITLFYVIFYSANAAFFYGMIKFFVYKPVQNSLQPNLILDQSTINRPGMAHQPVPYSKDQNRGTLLLYSQADQAAIDDWSMNLDNFLKPYQTANLQANQMHCDNNTAPVGGKSCVPDLDLWKYCNSMATYGYNESTPCFILTLNRVFGWQPDFYSKIEELPKEMPDDLVDHIKSLSPNERKQIWVSCQPEEPVDNENMGDIEIVSDNMGFHGYYYPFMNQPDYMNPLVAIRVHNPTLNIILNVECRVWAKNLIYDGNNSHRTGSVHIEFLIDDKTPPHRPAKIPHI